MQQSGLNASAINDVESYMNALGQRARTASRALARAPTAAKDQALRDIAR